jgi:transcriptional regulator with XRE-family HTH domain
MTESAIKTYRQSKGLSQRKLAKLLDVAVSTISRWESGKRKVGIELWPRVHAKTGIPLEEIRPDAFDEAAA